MIFWLMIGLFTFIIALVCFSPLLVREKMTLAPQRDALNKSLYFQRLQEIEQDSTLGLLDNTEQAKIELQRSLLDDIPVLNSEHTEKQKQKKAQGYIWFLSGFLSLLIVASLIYFKVGAWQAEQQLQHIAGKLEHFQQRAQQEATQPLTEQELSQFALSLRQHLQQYPQDAHSWWQLGQIGMNLNNPQLALDSYQKAHQLMPNNVEYQLSYARILMFSDDPSDKSQGENLLKQVIRQDHSNLDALGLLAFHYFEKENYKMAASTWEIMLKLIATDDPRYKLIERSKNAALAAENKGD